MLMSPRSSAPFCRDAPERMLPVWPGWMPTWVAWTLNRPVTKFIFAFSGAIGARLLPSSIAAPDPLAHQWSALIPHPMNTAAKRFGNAEAVAAAAVAPADDAATSPPQTGIDS